MKRLSDGMHTIHEYCIFAQIQICKHTNMQIYKDEIYKYDGMKEAKRQGRK
jgi:hypothetical protein